MSRLLSNRVTGALAGFAAGSLAGIGLAGVGWGLGGWACFVLGVAVAVAGWWAAAQGGPVARWCFGTAAAAGGLGFAAGFVGPILLQPDSPQGPLLGIFFTGPLAALAGATLGIAIGLAVRTRRTGENHTT